MKVKYSEITNPYDDMIYMIRQVYRNFFSSKIEYFVMDAATLDALRKGAQSKSGFTELESHSRIWTFHGIPIATVSQSGPIDQHFVTVVHGYEEIGA